MDGPTKWPLTEYTTCTPTTEWMPGNIHALTIPRSLFSASPTTFTDIEQLETRQLLGLFFEAYRLVESSKNIKTSISIELVTTPENDGVFAYTFWGFMSGANEKELLKEIMGSNNKGINSMPSTDGGMRYESKKRNGDEFRYFTCLRQLKLAWMVHNNMMITSREEHNTPSRISGEELTLRMLFSPAFAISARPRGQCHRTQDHVTSARCCKANFKFPRPDYTYTLFDVDKSPDRIFNRMLPDVQLVKHPPLGSLVVDALKFRLHEERPGMRAEEEMDEEEDGHEEEEEELDDEEMAFTAERRREIRSGSWTVSGQLFDNMNQGNIKASDVAVIKENECYANAKTFDDLIRVSNRRISVIAAISHNQTNTEELDEGDWENRFSVGRGQKLARRSAARVLYKNHSAIVAAQLYAGFRSEDRVSPYHLAVFKWTDEELSPRVQLLSTKDVMQVGEFVALECSRWRVYSDVFYVAPLHLEEVFLIGAAGHDSSNIGSCEGVCIALVFQGANGDTGKTFMTKNGCSFFVPGAYLTSTSHVTPRAFTSSDSEQIGEIFNADDATGAIFGVKSPGVQMTSELDRSIQTMKQLLAGAKITVRTVHIDPTTGKRTMLTQISEQMRTWFFSTNCKYLFTMMEKALATRVVILGGDESSRVKNSKNRAMSRERLGQTNGRESAVERMCALRRYRWEHVGTVEMYRHIRALAIWPPTRTAVDILWSFMCEKVNEAGYPHRESRDAWRLYSIASAICMRSVFTRHYASVGGKFANNGNNRKHDRDGGGVINKKFDPRTIVDSAVDRSLVVFFEHTVATLGVAPWLLINPLERDIRLALYLVFCKGDLKAHLFEDNCNYVEFEFHLSGMDGTRFTPLGTAVNSAMQGVPGWEKVPCADAIADFIYRVGPAIRTPQLRNVWKLPKYPAGMEVSNKQKFSDLRKDGQAEMSLIDVVESRASRMMAVRIHVDFVHPSLVPPHAKLQIALWLKEFCAFRHQGGGNVFFGAQPSIYKDDTAEPWIMYFPPAFKSATGLRIEAKGGGRAFLECSIDVHAAVTRAKTSFVLSEPLAEWAPRLAVPPERAGFGTPHFVGTTVEFGSGNHFEDLRDFVESCGAGDSEADLTLEECKVSGDGDAIYHWDTFPEHMFARTYDEFIEGNSLENFKLLFLRWRSLRDIMEDNDETLKTNARIINLAKYKIVYDVPEMRDGRARCRANWRGPVLRNSIDIAAAVLAEKEAADGMVILKRF